ncbi:GNAT family N-acetyltransferase [Actinopolymorpha pittospori]|uniref:RimJ/RimL family protein N-acetyltransferase n=1 Tax=Actinopolymorpha pittospori TaxID=648752 RepID=A0A927N159_9ACTN|nr:GNAT family N-acetyltransferase [Actinopolymorpha pittospori]MBE1610730.1 RimJ/RimL family protein N-acetyltransferase [Actinopolymorpha pittospori]
MECRTKRLLIRDFVETDREAVRGWRSDPDVTRYLDQPLGANPDGWFDAVLRYNAQTPRTSHDAAIVVRSTGQVIGWIGVSRSFDPASGDLVIGYALDQSAWGNNYMTEALIAVLSFGFGKLGARRITAQCYVANPASARVMEKAGMKHAGAALSADPALGHSVRYMALREEWRRPGRRRLGLALVLTLLALVAFPLGINTLLHALQRPEAPTDARLLPWAPRGDLAEDQKFIAEATAVWRHGTGGGMPGRLTKVYAVWAGTVGGGRVALLQGIGADRNALLAQVSDHGSPSRLRFDRQQPLVLEPRPAALVITYAGDRGAAASRSTPRSARVQLVLSPTDYAASTDHRARADGSGADRGRLTLWRRTHEAPLGTDSEWEELRPGKDGLTTTWAHQDQRSPYGSIVVFARSEGAAESVSTVAAAPDRLIAVRPPIRLADPTWGPRRLDLDSYDDGRAVLASSADLTARQGLEVALLASERDPEGRLAMLEVRSAGTRKVALVAWSGGRVECVTTHDYPDVPSRAAAALGCLDPLTGTLVIGAVPGPGAGRVVLRDAAGKRVMPEPETEPRLGRLVAASLRMPVIWSVFDHHGVGAGREVLAVSETLRPPR